MTITQTFSDYRLTGRRSTIKYAGSSATSVTNSYSVTNFGGSRTGGKVPDYREKIRNNQQAGSTFVSDRYKVLSMTPGAFSASTYNREKPKDLYASSTFSGYYLPPAGIAHLVGPTLSKARAIALSKAYRIIAERQQHMNSMAVLAELGQVMKQFGRPFEAMVGLVERRMAFLETERRALKNKWPPAKFKVKYLDVISSTYLEFVFGLLPLISDTRDAAEALARWKNEADLPVRPDTIRARGSDSQVQVNYQSGGVTGEYQSTCSHVEKIVTESRSQFVVKLKPSVVADFGSNERLIELLGFKPENFAPSLWEAVPWSWLVDYFLNVQSILEAGATSTAAVAWIVESATQRTTVDRTAFVDVHLSQIAAKAQNLTYVLTAGGSAGNSKISRTNVTRTLPSTLGIPPLTLSIPGSAKRYTNMLAVLLQKRPRNPTSWLS